jgi:hypothetical protein
MKQALSNEKVQKHNERIVAPSICRLESHTSGRCECHMEGATTENDGGSISAIV